MCPRYSFISAISVWKIYIEAVVPIPFVTADRSMLDNLAAAREYSRSGKKSNRVWKPCFAPCHLLQTLWGLFFKLWIGFCTTINSYMLFNGKIWLLHECNAFVCVYFSFCELCALYIFFWRCNTYMYLCIVALSFYYREQNSHSYRIHYFIQRFGIFVSHHQQ